MISYGGFKKPRLSKQEKELFRKNNIHYSANNWTFALPPNYKTVRSNLRKLKIKNNNQIIFGFPECDALVSKKGLAKQINKNYSKLSQLLIPKTYVLSDYDDIRKFLKDYVPGKLYIMKNKKQRKEGLKLTNNFKDISTAIKAGSYSIVQQYIDDPFTINGRKLNLRIYLLVTYDKKNGIVGYIHPYGKCIYTNKNYDKSSMDFENQITSYNLDPQIYSINFPINLNEKTKFYYSKLPLTTLDLMKYFTWMRKKNEFENVTRKITAITTFVLESAREKLSNLVYDKNPHVQLFGMDFILDKNMKPYLMEINKGPQMSSCNRRDYELKYKVFEDIYGLIGLIKNKKNRFKKLPKLREAYINLQN